MKNSANASHHFFTKKHSLVLALGLLGFSSSPIMAMPVLPVVVFDNLLTDEPNPPITEPNFDNLTDELLPAPAIDAHAVANKLTAIRQLYQDQTQNLQNNNTDNTQPTFAIFNQLDGTTTSGIPIARLQATEPPVGLDLTGFAPKKADNNTNLGNAIAQSNTGTYTPLDPNDYLPPYQASNIPPTAVIEGSPIINKQPNLLKKAYNKLFKDGADSLTKLSAKIYLATPNQTAENEIKNLETPQKNEDVFGIFDSNWQFENDRLASIDTYNDNVSLKSANTAIEPFKNIANALANLDEESNLNLTTSRQRLRETILNASRAVGFYDIIFNLRQESDGKLSVIIHKVGDPVSVTSQVIDIRGKGAELPSFQQIKENAAPKVGQALHHGEYETTKTSIDQNSLEHGFFDAKWLTNSVDVVLPDNTADVSLVYDTGDQYVFDEVVFFTIDAETGQLTTDPNKLPVNLDLLKKMVGFKPNEPFVRSQVTKLSNELTATRYFNASNVETVLPSTTEFGLEFVQGAGSQNTNNDQITPNDNIATLSADDKSPPLNPTNTIDNLDHDNTIITDDDGQILATISPIDFSPSQAIVEKVALVKSKAERLLASPDDRVLDESTKTATSLLGKISNAVQKVAKMVLPDESKDIRPTLAEGEAPPILAGRKPAEQVFHDKKVPLYVFVMADKPKDAQIGIGWGSDSGTRLTGKLENNLMNKKGFQSGIEIGFAEHQKTANAYISRPLSHPVNDKASANIKFEQKDIEQSVVGFDVRTNTLETTLSRTRIKENSWHRNYWFRYRLDDLKTNAPIATLEDLPVRFLASGARQNALLAGYSMSKSVQNNLTAPTVGYRQSYSLELGGQKFGSDANMVFLRAGVGGVYSFGNNQWGTNRANQLVGRLDLGYLWTDNFEKVPYSLRYFAGGDQSVRGYNYESLSPISSGGYLTGGQALAVGSIEYNREIREGLRVAAFADAGNAYDKNFKNDTKIGLGVGVRYASPIGTVRVDIAKGVADKHNSTPIKLHFLIGLPF